MAVRLTGSINFGVKGELVRIKNVNGDLSWLSKKYVRDADETHERERSAPNRLMSCVSLVTGKEDRNENQMDQSSNVQWHLGEKSWQSKIRCMLHWDHAIGSAQMMNRQED